MSDEADGAHAETDDMPRCRVCNRFVIVVIQEFFNKDRETATQIMLKIHLDGRGVCGVFSRDLAATKVNQVMEAAAQAGHPLQCVSEPVE